MVAAGDDETSRDAILRDRWYYLGRLTHDDAQRPQLIRLEFTSAFEMLDFVQVVSDHLARGVGLDEDAMHWVSVAIRESVINAIKHGNRNDASKHVFVEFETVADGDVPELIDSRPRSGRGLRSRDGGRTRSTPRTC